MKANVLEIFKSIQGEGKYTGVKQVFVRFFECNMHCSWCDTPHSIGDTTRKFDQYTVDELLDEVDPLLTGCHSVSITGGEPLLQAEFLKSFLPKLRERNIPIHLETNGVFPKELKEILELVDVIAMDIKMPSSTKCKEYWQEHKDFLKVAEDKELFIKTVVTSDTDVADINRTIDLVCEVNPNVLFILQPNYFQMQNGVMKRCLEFEELCSKKLSNVRIIGQTHKFMKLR